MEFDEVYCWCNKWNEIEYNYKYNVDVAEKVGREINTNIKEYTDINTYKNTSKDLETRRNQFNHLF